ncbi:hypothetical protein OIU85_003848 [Salix viminalis]|uniref:Uncharacterized protein n=1 Tax=Salix viminalis TaxID=40686 RepID=A0A9Q0T1Z4_SALVM|nr:hypothetical protein OIU85_003848 [Salix viminalis]
MADDGAEVEKREIVLGLRKKPDKPSKISKSKPKAAEVEKEKRVIVLALRKEPDLPTKIPKPKPKLAKRKLEKQGNVKKKNKKRFLNDKGDGGRGVTICLRMWREQ